MKRTKTINYLCVVFLVLLLVPLIWATYVYFDRAGVFGQDVLIVNILLIIVFYVINRMIYIIVHELGHLIFGLCAGFRPYSFSIGPIILRKGGLGFSLKSQYGSCVMYPVNMRNFYRKDFWYLFGGSLFSLLGAGAGALFLFYPALGLNQASYLFLSLWFLVFTYGFFREVLPYADRVSESDGAKMLGILRKSPDMQMNLKLFSIQCELIAGVRPKDFQKEMLFDTPVLPDNSTPRLLMENYRYLYYVDRGEIESAVKSMDFIETYAKEAEPCYYAALMSDVYFTTLYYKRDLEKADRLFDDVADYLKAERNIVNLRIEMCRELYAEKNPKHAVTIAKNALAMKRDYPLKGIAEFEDTLIRQMLTDAEQERDREIRALKRDTLTEYRG